MERDANLARGLRATVARLRAGQVRVVDADALVWLGSVPRQRPPMMRTRPAAVGAGLAGLRIGVEDEWQLGGFTGGCGRRC